jgi:hypothetical protein
MTAFDKDFSFDILAATSACDASRHRRCGQQNRRGALLGSYDTIAPNWVTLASPNGTLICGLTITSDCRNEKGRPFAGSQAALIQEMQLLT